jgi:putative proteasome-type protease
MIKDSSTDNCKIQMTYCLGIINRFGIVVAADSRTNAGVDYISAYRKLFDFSRAGDRALLICTSGNLSMTQGVLTQLQRDIQNHEEINLHSLASLYDIASYIGAKSREIQERDRPWLERDKIDYQCNFILGGQIKGEEPKLYLIYPQGNFIQATKETPFLQIGETKYGKPILDRTITYDTPLDAMAKCALLSIDSTMKSNISVGPPIHLARYETDSFVIRHKLQLRLGDPYLAKMRNLWEEYVRQAFDAMPNIEWQHETQEVQEDILID